MRWQTAGSFIRSTCWMRWSCCRFQCSSGAVSVFQLLTRLSRMLAFLARCQDPKGGFGGGASCFLLHRSLSRALHCCSRSWSACAHCANLRCRCHLRYSRYSLSSSTRNTQLLCAQHRDSARKRTKSSTGVAPLVILLCSLTTDRSTMYDYLKRMKHSNGAFRVSSGGEFDTRSARSGDQRRSN